MSSDGQQLSVVKEESAKSLQQSSDNQVAEDMTVAFKLLCKSAKHDRVSLQQLRQQAATYREQLATAAREKAVLQQNVKHLEAVVAGADGSSFDVRHVRRLHQEYARLHQKLHDHRREIVDLQHKHMQESAERARYMQHLHLEAATMQEHIRQQEQLLKVQQTRVLEMKQQLDDMRAAQSKLKPLSLRQDLTTLTKQATPRLLTPKRHADAPRKLVVMEAEAAAEPPEQAHNTAESKRSCSPGRDSKPAAQGTLRRLSQTQGGLSQLAARMSSRHLASPTRGTRQAGSCSATPHSGTQLV